MRRLMIVLFITCLIGVAVSIDVNDKSSISQLSLSNVEALADIEGNKCKCLGVGSLDCPFNKDKVKFIW